MTFYGLSSSYIFTVIRLLILYISILLQIEIDGYLFIHLVRRVEPVRSSAKTTTNKACLNGQAGRTARRAVASRYTKKEELAFSSRF